MRKLTVLALALLYVVSLAAVSAFAANASKFDATGDSHPHMVPIESRQQPTIDNFEGGTTTPKTFESTSALGYFMSPGAILETSDYDIAHNARMARQIGVGTDGRVHFDWTYKPLAGAASTRSVHYRSWTNGSGLTGISTVSDDVAKTPGRFCALDVYNNKAMVIYHYNKTAAITMTTSTIDAGSGAGAFAAQDPPADVINCQAIACRGAFTNAYIWPDMASDKDGSGNVVVHIVALEGNTSAGFSAITYFRGAPGSSTFQNGMYGTCGTYIDSTSATAYTVAADPNSDKVVIAYPKSRQGNRVNNDIAYRLSTDIGQTWGPVVNITNYATGAKERAAEDCSVLFDGRGNFHILFIGSPYDSVLSDVSDQECKLKHWASNNPSCISLVVDANNHDDNAVTKAFDQNICTINISQCARTGTNDTLLYVVYKRYLGTTASPDRSAKNYPNGEVFLQASSTWGETWGEPINLTNSPSNGCTAGNCADDRYTSSARYSTDSVRILYYQDLDAGSFAGNETSTADLMSPYLFLSYPCVNMDPYKSLSVTPSRVKYPFHAVANASTIQVLTMTNAGNATLTWNSSIAYTIGSGWLSVPASGSVTAGCTNSANINMTAGPIATEGLYKATVTFSYDTPTKTVDVPVDFYVFNSWFLPQDIDLRTASNRTMVNQTSQVADDVDKYSFSYFADLTEDFITDASLIMGNSASNLSWKIFTTGQGDPTPSNNFGWLYALNNVTIDTTTFGSYRFASGTGTNRDSTLGFEVKYYAPKHADSADFYIVHVDLHKGVKNPSGTVSSLSVAFACDWDVPDDSAGSANYAFADPTRQMVYLKGAYSATKERGYGAIAGWREDKVALTGGFSWENDQEVYSLRGFQVDSVWNHLGLCNSFTGNDSLEDQSSILVIGKNLTIGPADHLVFDVILAAKRGEDNAAGLTGLNDAVDKAKAFICDHVSVGSPLCAACSGCGDANHDGGVDISDAVFLIQFIFAGGAAPQDCNYQYGYGDANGDGGVDISDAVYLIQYIFAGGPAPHCQ